MDGFRSITVYDRNGYLAKNTENRHSVNNISAVPDGDGRVTIQFGRTPLDAPNRLPIVPGWNNVVRLYRPPPEDLGGS